MKKIILALSLLLSTQSVFAAEVKKNLMADFGGKSDLVKIVDDFIRISKS